LNMSYFNGCLTAVLIMNSAQLIKSKSIPTVDMSQSPEISAEAFLHAATKYGFFYLQNHEISREDLQSALQLNRELFDLDMTEKMDLVTNDTHWGYIEYQHETTDLDKQKEGDTKESFMIANNDVNSARTNQWPSKSLGYEWEERAQHYMDQLSHLSVRLAELVALSLNLTSDYFEQPGYRDHAQELFYLLHYPPQQSDPDSDLFGAGSHTDYQLFTILLTDSNPGLQILYEDEWMDVEYREDAFIVNVADTLQLWSNGMFKSSTHRVVLNGDNHRYSIPYFVGVNMDLQIGCLPNTVIPGDEQYGQCNHKTFRAGDYVKYKFQQTYVDYQEDQVELQQDPSCTVHTDL